MTAEPDRERLVDRRGRLRDTPLPPLDDLADRLITEAGILSNLGYPGRVNDTIALLSEAAVLVMNDRNWKALTTPAHVTPALAAAALAGPIAEDVTCPTCEGARAFCRYPDKSERCTTCDGWGTVRLVVHVVTPEVAGVADRLRWWGDDWLSQQRCSAERAAAAILDPKDGDQ